MTSFVATSMLLLWQKTCFVVTNVFVATKPLSRQKWYLWQLPPVIVTGSVCLLQKAAILKRLFVSGLCLLLLFFTDNMYVCNCTLSWQWTHGNVWMYVQHQWHKLTGAKGNKKVGADVDCSSMLFQFADEMNSAWSEYWCDVLILVRAEFLLAVSGKRWNVGKYSLQSWLS